MNQLKLGRGARKFDPRVPRRDSLILPGAILEPPPIVRNWADGMPDDLGMMLNDTLGDCTCAGFYHALQVWSFNTLGVPITETNANVKLLYQMACGYDPQAEGEGQGGVEQDVLTYLLNHGAPAGPGGTQRHKISAFFEVDPKKQMDVRYEIDACGLVYIGFNVPRFLMEGEPPLLWDVPKKDKNDIVGGHAVILPGYDTEIFNTISWGRKDYQMTEEFFDTYVDEVYPIIDPFWINAKGTTPAGRTLAELRDVMQALM